MYFGRTQFGRAAALDEILKCGPGFTGDDHPGRIVVGQLGQLHGCDRSDTLQNT